jgi:hypothetical protein
MIVGTHVFNIIGRRRMPQCLTANFFLIVLSAVHHCRDSRHMANFIKDVFA